ncbi:MAG: ABC transporter permease, partial [Proteobacteria bacterium]|nr:ABC transporter permease [Pseudomonadota bacterium]
MTTLLLAARLSRRELRGGLAGFRVFLACLMLGVGAIAAVGSLAAGIDAALRADAGSLLGGDVELSFAQRSATPEQLRFLTDSGTVSAVVEMRGMARTPAGQTLVELKAVDSAYPLLGAVKLAGAATLADALARRDGAWGAAVERATLERLNASLGDSVTVGDQSFVVRAVIDAEPDRSANVFTLGPRLMIALPALEATGLARPGTLARYQYRLRLPTGRDVDGWIAEVKQRFPAAGWRIRGLSEAAPGVQRWIDRIAQLLTLVGLTALLVGGVGVATAVKSYLDSKTTTIATLKCLGAASVLVFQVYLLQVLTLAALGIGAGLVLGALTPLAVGPLIADKLPVAARVGLYPLPLAIAAGFGLLTTLAFALWPLARAREVPPAALFRALVAPSRRWPRPLAIFATVLAAACLAGLAILTSSDRKFGLTFVAGAVAALGAFTFLAWGLAQLARRVGGVRWPGLRLALANMHRPGSPMPGVVLSLGLGLGTLVMVALVQGNLVYQLREQIPDVAPSFFFIDLQPDQVVAFDALLASLPGVGEVKRVPSLRGRIVGIGGVPVERARVA